MSVSKSSRWIDRLAAFTLSAALGLVWLPAHADSEEMLDTLQVHGFLSQALIITDDNNFFGPSSEGEGSVEFTEIGANVSLRPHEDVLVAAQVLSRRAGGDENDAHPTLDYGVIDYQFLSNQRRTLGIQVGRFKNPFGFYNQTRDVAFTRPGILLPQSIYFDRTRSLGLSADGASVYAEERFDSGIVRFKGGVGTPSTHNLENQLFHPGLDSEVKGDTSSIAQIIYEHGNGRFNAAISTADVNLDIKLGPNNGKINFRPWILSLQYDTGSWALTSEYAIRHIDLKGAGAIRESDLTGESWYIQYSKRLHSDWQWLLRYDRLVNDRGDRSGKEYEEQGLGPAHSRFSEDITLGLQWRVNPRLLLAAEYHHIDGTGWLPPQDNPDISATERHWNMLLFQFSLRF